MAHMPPLSVPLSLYSPLAHPESIRLLEFSVDRSSGGYLECTLTEQLQHPDVSKELQDCNYCALSYAWGNDRRRAAILCNGVEVLISRNLHDALVHILPQLPFKKIWIDAICINQRDLAEKSTQVAMMGRIFWEADVVFAWLGRDMQATAAIWSILEVAAEDNGPVRDSVHTAFADAWSSDNSDPEFLFGDVRAPLKLFKAELDLLQQREWFHRTWTYQEAVVADILILCCGSLRMDFETFNRGYKVLLQMNVIRKDYKTEADNISEGREDFRRGKLSLQKLLYMTNLRHASDSRDRVFSLAALLDSSEYALIRADYNSCAEEVYALALLACVQIDGCTQLLHRAGLWPEETDLRKTQTVILPLLGWERVDLLDAILPGWSPNWTGGSAASKRLARQLFPGHPISFDSKRECIQIGPRTGVEYVHIRGRAFGIICFGQQHDQDIRASNDPGSVHSHLRTLQECIHFEADDGCHDTWDVSASAFTPMAKVSARLCSFRSDMKAVCQRCSCSGPQIASPSRVIRAPELSGEILSGDWLCRFLGSSDIVALRPVEESATADGSLPFKKEPAFRLVTVLKRSIANRLYPLDLQDKEEEDLTAGEDLAGIETCGIDFVIESS